MYMRLKHAPRDREPTRIISKKMSSLFSEGKVIRKSDLFKKKVLSSFELRMCLSLAFRKYSAVRMSRPVHVDTAQLRRNKSSRVGNSNRCVSASNDFSKAEERRAYMRESIWRKRQNKEFREKVSNAKRQKRSENIEAVREYEKQALLKRKAPNPESVRELNRKLNSNLRKATCITQT